MPVTCCIIGCHNNGNDNKVGYFSIPTVVTREGPAVEALLKKRRAAWIKAINRKDLTEEVLHKKRWYKVCGDHFVSGKPSYGQFYDSPDWVPSLKLGYSKKSPSISTVKSKRKSKKQLGTGAATDADPSQDLVMSVDFPEEQAMGSTAHGPEETEKENPLLSDQDMDLESEDLAAEERSKEDEIKPDLGCPSAEVKIEIDEEAPIISGLSVDEVDRRMNLKSEDLACEERSEEDEIKPDLGCPSVKVKIEIDEEAPMISGFSVDEVDRRMNLKSEDLACEERDLSLGDAGSLNADPCEGRVTKEAPIRPVMMFRAEDIDALQNKMKGMTNAELDNIGVVYQQSSDVQRRTQQASHMRIKTQQASHMRIKTQQASDMRIKTQQALDAPLGIKTHQASDVPVQIKTQQTPDVQIKTVQALDVSVRKNAERESDVPMRMKFEQAWDMKTHQALGVPVQMKTHQVLDVPVKMKTHQALDVPVQIKTYQKLDVPVRLKTQQASDNQVKPEMIDLTNDLERDQRDTSQASSSNRLEMKQEVKTWKKFQAGTSAEIKKPSIPYEFMLICKTRGALEKASDHSQGQATTNGLQPALKLTRHAHSEHAGDVASSSPKSVECSKLKPSIDIYICFNCQHYFPSVDAFAGHTCSNVNGHNFSCVLCGKSVSKEEFQDHLMKHVIKDFVPHCCHVCGARFQQASHLNDHFLLNHSYACDICNVKFPEESLVERHKRYFHKDFSMPKVKTYACQICGLKFEKFYFYIKHLKEHPEMIKFYCEVCGKGFAYQGQLTSHLWIHNKEKRFQCEECGKSFRRLQYFKKHQLKHKGIKQFMCEICGKKLASKEGFDSHVLAHKAPPPFKCDLCEKGYYTMGNLRNHMKDKHKVSKDSVTPELEQTECHLQQDKDRVNEDSVTPELEQTE
ncbi:zinc finger protein 226 [Elysia marginata]|uniref:Zinc finger protein 226 n=1 Tax=Elysia marginata TaxID=1093978 RepID=A0AAV4HVE6_9GAST|nr:zinc finger protein 226 [Elysia marginata]